MRGRGLKHYAELSIYQDEPSPPVRGRGLKRLSALHYPPFILVAPRAGAWIETSYTPQTIGPTKGRPPCGGVD